MAEVSACVLREMAADLEAGEDERCVVCGRTARSHGGLCCFHKYDEQPTCDACVADEPASCLTEHSPPQTECDDECSGLCGEHHWLDRPESDTRECLICGLEVAG